jgi:uncharacterized protein YggU (UPF0235/DUF167 family)
LKFYLTVREILENYREVCMIVLKIKVIPSAGRHAWVLEPSGVLKCFLKGAAQKGEANRELIASIARLCNIGKDDVRIMAGEASRNKIIKLYTELSYTDILKKMGFEYQQIIG